MALEHMHRHAVFVYTHVYNYAYTDKWFGTKWSCPMVVVIGFSESNTKTITVPPNYTCPSAMSNVDSSGFEHKPKPGVVYFKETHKDTFSISKSGTTLSTTRTDSDGGWDLPLRIICTRVQDSRECAPITGNINPGKRDIVFTDYKVVTVQSGVPGNPRVHRRKSWRPTWAETVRCIVA